MKNSENRGETGTRKYFPERMGGFLPVSVLGLGEKQTLCNGINIYKLIKRSIITIIIYNHSYPDHVSAFYRREFSVE